MASTTRTVPNESQRATTSGSERPGRPSGDGADGWLKEKVTSVVNTRKSQVSDSLDAMAETVRRVGEPLHAEPLARLGGYADGAARAIERVAADLRGRDLDELTEDVRGFARRRPAVYLGAGLAAGIVAARFLKSSGEHQAALAPGRRHGRGHEDRGGQEVVARRPADGGQAKTTTAGGRGRGRQE